MRFLDGQDFAGNGVSLISGFLKRFQIPLVVSTIKGSIIRFSHLGMHLHLEVRRRGMYWSSPSLAIFGSRITESPKLADIGNSM
jgi:hypothetical protein